LNRRIAVVAVATMLVVQSAALSEAREIESFGSNPGHL
jgi:hypothetical protein